MIRITQLEASNCSYRRAVKKEDSQDIEMQGRSIFI